MVFTTSLKNNWQLNFKRVYIGHRPLTYISRNVLTASPSEYTYRWDSSLLGIPEHPVWMSILRKRHCVLQFQTNQNVLHISIIYTKYTYRRFGGWNILKSNNIDHINQKRKPLGVVYFRKCFTNLNILHVMNLEALMSLVKLSQGNQLFRYCNLTPRCVKCFYQVSNPVIPCKVGNGKLNHRNNNTRRLYNIC